MWHVLVIPRGTFQLRFGFSYHSPGGECRRVADSCGGSGVAPARFNFYFCFSYYVLALLIY